MALLSHVQLFNETTNWIEELCFIVTNGVGNNLSGFSKLKGHLFLSILGKIKFIMDVASPDIYHEDIL
jgi:hypothetical protein